MADKSKEEIKADFEKKLKKTDSLKKDDFIRDFATRAMLEKDFKDDTIRVSFNTSPSTRRTILSRKPTPSEYLKILTLYIEAMRLESVATADTVEKLKEVQLDMYKLAADLSTDKQLDEKFWANCISLMTLYAFFQAVMESAQQGNIPEGELKSFRGK